jgi:hypothetical protein
MMDLLAGRPASRLAPVNEKIVVLLLALAACRSQEIGQACSGSQACPIGQACEAGACVATLDAGAGCSGAASTCGSGLVCAAGYFMCAAPCATLYSSSTCGTGEVCACELGSNHGACVRDQCYADADCGATPSGLACAHFASDGGGLCLVGCQLGSSSDCVSINEHCALFPGGTAWCSPLGQGALGQACDIARGPTACAKGSALPLACINDLGTAEPSRGTLTCHEVGCAAGTCSGGANCVSGANVSARSGVSFSYCK